MLRAVVRASRLGAKRSPRGLASLADSGQADAVVLLSGGVDSATCAAIARAEGYRLRALSFDYGQRHRYELQCAAHVAQHFGAVSHAVARIDLGIFGGSALTDDALDVPKGRDVTPDGIPITYVPARNTIFLSYALALAETTGARDIFIGANAVDYSGYPDCRPEYLEAFQNMSALALKASVEDPSKAPRIRAPLVHWTKTQIIKTGLDLGVDFALTSSCYDPDPVTGEPCSLCDSCMIRSKAFRELGIPVDPAVAKYAEINAEETTT